MDLKTWMEENRWTGRALAERLGMSEVNMSRLKTGKQKCSLETAAKIVEFTNGEVTLKDLAEVCDE